MTESPCDKHEDTIRNLAVNGLSLKAIAQQLNLKYSTLKDWAYKKGIKVCKTNDSYKGKGVPQVHPWRAKRGPASFVVKNSSPLISKSR